MKICVNGDALELEGTPSVTQLLLHLGLGNTLVAVERNREIVPRAEHPQTQLQEGDELEVVHFVGGG
jgi:sulfur carrier protein